MLGPDLCSEETKVGAFLFGLCQEHAYRHDIRSSNHLRQIGAPRAAYALRFLACLRAICR
jgi:hypothetical protein